jgi:hypothetical protein
MKAIHVLSTEGWRLATKSILYDMDTPELLTMVLSALQWRKFGGIQLYTDAVGKEFVERRKFSHLYDKIVMLPNLPRINHQVFWDIYKLVALEMNGGEAIICDLDLVLFNRKRFERGCVYFGHTEPITMQPYPSNRDHFERFGFSYGWDWSAPAVNTCYIEFPEHCGCFSSTWVKLALGFAEIYSDHLAREGGNVGWQFEPALFASQRVLGMLLASVKAHGNYLFNLGELPHHDFNPYAFHLWGRKEIYRTCVEPRAQMLNWLRAKIIDFKHRERCDLKELDLFSSFLPNVEARHIADRGRVAIEPDMNDTPLTRTVITAGKYWRAMDPCSGLTRTLRFDEPEKIYRGDILFSEVPGGQCSIWWNKRKLAELETPVAPGKADWIWNLPIAGVGPVPDRAEQSTNAV